MSALARGVAPSPGRAPDWVLSAGDSPLGATELRDWWGGVEGTSETRGTGAGEGELMGPLTIGGALSERRRELGLDLTRAANAVGVNRSTYAAYERDTRRLSAEALRPLAAFLVLSLDEILGLYAATCVTQARRVLFGEASEHAEPAAERTSVDGVIRRAARGDDMSVVQRVYFDAQAAHDHSPGRSMKMMVSDGPAADNLIDIGAGRARGAADSVPTAASAPDTGRERGAKKRKRSGSAKDRGAESAKKSKKRGKKKTGKKDKKLTQKNGKKKGKKQSKR